MTFQWITQWSVVAALAVPLASPSLAGEFGPQTAHPPPRMEPVAEAGAPGGTPVALVSDATIARTLDFWYESQLAEARLAVTKSTNRDLQSLAQNSVTMNSIKQQTLRDLSARALFADRAGDAIANPGEELATAVLLAGKSGAAFDRAFVTSQIDRHRDFLRLIAYDLQPSVTNSELRTFLSEANATARGNLAKLRALQAKLGADPVGI